MHKLTLKTCITIKETEIVGEVIVLGKYRRVSLREILIPSRWITHKCTWKVFQVKHLTESGLF